MSILKAEIMRTYDIRQSTAERIMEIAEMFANAAKAEYFRGKMDAYIESPEIVYCQDCKNNTSTRHNPVCKEFYGMGGYGNFCSMGQRREK